MSLTTFSFATVSLLINGERAEGLWEGDDPIMLEPTKDDGTAFVGVDGHAIVSRPVDKSVQITLKCLPTGAAHQLLSNLHKSMSENLVGNFSISLTDTSTGEGGSSVEATIVKRPSLQYGESANAREWVIFANNWERNEVEYTLG